MKVNRLCQRLGIPKVKNNHEIFLITEDSKDCIENSVFFAIEGNRIDGHNKIEEAINNGAKTIVLTKKIEEHFGVNYIYCRNVKRLLALSLNIYYKHITKNLKFIGVIGTNGKTTTTTLLYNYLEYTHKRAMLIGSNGCFAKDFFKKHDNTTPRGIELYGYFSYAQRHKIKYIIMEVSSIAVSELRVLDIKYDALIFTNLSEDHLDYHKTMERYLFAKAIPFYKLSSQNYAIMNADDAAFDLVLKHTNAKIITYGIQQPSMVQASKIYANENGIEFHIGSFHVKSNLIGRFNVYNILPLYCVCDIFGFNKLKLSDFLNEFKQVAGRMNSVDIGNKHIIIDYAHTEQAIKNAIIETERIAKGNVYVVVGCGGNREKEKRSKIGALLSSLNCIPIITSDNPRFEKPMDIIQDILRGVKTDVVVIENRQEAITYALNQLKDEDFLLVLGKGCENYIDVLGHKEEYSDFKVVEQWKRDNL